MRREGDLWPRVASFEALLAAARRAARGKKRSRPVARFLADVETNVLALLRALEDGSWRPSAGRVFEIRDPKPRTISVVPFPDRVVHHALIAVLGPVLDRSSVADSYACRVGRGSHAALRRARELARRSRFFLKTDVRHCFETIPQETVLALVARRVRDRRVLELLGRIVRAPVSGSPPGRGLPIGSLTSQHLANFALGELDGFLRRDLRERRTIRYMDDVLVFADDRERLEDVLARLEDRALSSLGLELKLEATRIAPVAEGIPFLGFLVFPGAARLGRVARLRFARRLRRKERACRAGSLPEEALAREVSSLVAHVSSAATRAFRRSITPGPCTVGRNPRMWASTRSCRMLGLS